MRRTLAVASAGLVALVAAGVALAGNGGLAPVTPQSPNAERISDTYYFILGFTGAIFLIVETALVVFVIRFRSRGRSRRVEGPQIIGHRRLELIWTAVPVLILAVIAAFVLYKLPGIKNTPSASASDQLAIKVEAHQYYWRFVYPNGATAIDEMTVPEGRVVTLTVTSADVAHSWWIPALGGKIDAIPGRTNHTWFQALQEGSYEGRCAEFCGIQHAAMTATVHAVSDSEYEHWLAKQSSVGSGLGQEEFEGVCAKCHGFQGQGDIGPPLQGKVLTPASLAETIRNGVGLMPPVADTWTDREVAAVVRYVRTTVAKGAATSGG